MLRLLPLLLLALGLAPQPRAQPTHTISLQYERSRSDLIPATLSIQPIERGARPRWGGAVNEAAVLTTDGRWIRIDAFSRRDDGATARVRVPTPDAIAFILVRGERGPWKGWKIEEGDASSYSKIEWTLLAQDGEEPDEPEPQPECDFSGCSMTAIRDPYTCECIEDIRDPWGDEATTELLSIGV